MPVISVSVFICFQVVTTRHFRRWGGGGLCPHKKKKHLTQEKTKKNCGRVRPKWFFCAFKLGFFQLKPLILKSNLVDGSKHLVVECMFKNMRSAILFDMFSILILDGWSSFKAIVWLFAKTKVINGKLWSYIF